MREYKFRGRRIDTGEWVYGYLLITQMSGVYIIGTKTKSKPHKIGGEIASVSIGDVAWQVDPDTVGQCTGLHDKNGKEIYEGDVIRAAYWDPSIGEVRFIEGGFCVFNEEVPGYPTDIKMYYDSTGCMLEVIGNIHDNPELLDG